MRRWWGEVVAHHGQQGENATGWEGLETKAAKRARHMHTNCMFVGLAGSIQGTAALVGRKSFCGYGSRRPMAGRVTRGRPGD
jgi:hypothetical protein